MKETKHSTRAGNAPRAAHSTGTTPAADEGPPDWDQVIRLAWRPAWSIRSRRSALAPFVALLRAALRGLSGKQEP